MEEGDALPERRIEHGLFFADFDLDVDRLKAYFVFLPHGLVPFNPLSPRKLYGSRIPGSLQSVVLNVESNRVKRL